MLIRPAILNDHRALCEIDSVVPDESHRQDEIAAWLHAGTCHLVETGDEIAAYGVLTNHFFGMPFIEMLMVGRQFRRRGLGLALIDHFRASSSGRKLFSSTNMSNLPMQALFIKTGFKPSGYIDNLDENDPEIVFYSPVPPEIG